jgi:hypothetical protein
VTVVATVPSEVTATAYGTVQSVVYYTVAQSVTGPAVTTTYMATLVSSIAVPPSSSKPNTTSSSGPAQVTTNEGPTKRAGAATIAGAGAIALFAVLF